jgi:putative transposase
MVDIPPELFAPIALIYRRVRACVVLVSRFFASQVYSNLFLLLDDAGNRRKRKGEAERGTFLLFNVKQVGMSPLLWAGALLARIAAMPRYARKVADDSVYHVLNRGNERMRIFQKQGDFEAFVKLLEEGRKRIGMRILGYCLMDNHWHLVLWPRRGTELAKFVGWVASTHVRRWREHRGSGGQGHLYQGRYKSFLVQRDEDFLTLMRYVESNPLRAKMVRRAEDWPWTSLGGAAGSGGVKVELEEWPVERPRNWAAIVNEPMAEEEVERLRVSVRRERPFGGVKWVRRMVAKLGLEWTVRDPWRPKKKKGMGDEKRKGGAAGK